MDISPLSTMLITQDDAISLMAYLDELQDSLTTKTVEDSPSSVSPWQQPVLSTLNINKVDMENKVQADEFLMQLKECIKKLPVLNLTVAVDLSGNPLEELSNWLQQQTEGKILINLHKDESIVAGATVSFNGYFKDYSVQGKLDEILAQQST